MIRIPRKIFVALSFLIAGTILALAAQAATGAHDRTVLPIPQPNYPSITELDALSVADPV